jgi:hypothetical protein
MSLLSYKSILFKIYKSSECYNLITISKNIKPANVDIPILAKMPPQYTKKCVWVCVCPHEHAHITNNSVLNTTSGHHSVRFVNADPSLGRCGGKAHHVLMKGMESAKELLDFPGTTFTISYLEHWERMRLVIHKNDLLQLKSVYSTPSAPFLLKLSSYSFSKYPFLLLSVRKMLPQDSLEI